MKFRLNYKVSEKTALDHEVIILNILSRLSHKKYKVISFTESNFKFKTNPWELGWNFSPITIDGGEFKLTNSKNGSTIELNYYDNILPRLFVIAFLAITLIIEGAYEGILFFVAFFLITGIIHTFTLKNRARELLREILNTDTQ
ncbi:MAG: hypothetical protein ABIN13_02620 [Mucilaginibacter sp.]